MVSISTRWQDWGGLGNAYLPIYLSAFGGCICITAIFLYLYKKVRKLNSWKIMASSFLISLIFSFACIITYASNTYVVASENPVLLYPRQIIENGLDNGLFKDIPVDSILMVNSNNVWDQPAFYRMHTGIHFSHIGTINEPFLDQIPLEKALPQSKLVGHSGTVNQYSFSDGDNVYFLDYYSASKNEGYVILGKSHELTISGNKITGVTTNDAKFYIKSGQFHGIDQVLISGQEVNPEKQPQALSLREKDMVLLFKGNDWKLFSINTGGTLIEPMSLKILGVSK
jgi:hypothetical protein